MGVPSKGTNVRGCGGVGGLFVTLPSPNIASFSTPFLLVSLGGILWPGVPQASQGAISGLPLGLELLPLCPFGLLGGVFHFPRRNASYCSKIAVPLEVVSKDPGSCLSQAVKPETVLMYFDTVKQNLTCPQVESFLPAGLEPQVRWYKVSGGESGGPGRTLAWGETTTPSAAWGGSVCKMEGGL